MKLSRKARLSFALALALAAFSAPLVSARSTNDALPPLPEWPVVGPILRILGLAEPEPEPDAAPLPTPNPELPEYRVSSTDDLKALSDIGPNESVRIIASDEDLNRIIKEILTDANLVEDARLDMDFEPGLATMDLNVSSSLLDQVPVEIELPAAIRGRNIDATATLGVEANNCSLNVSFEELSVNNWRLGLRPLATRMVNERIPDFWPSEVCVQGVYLMEGEIAVEGYRHD